MQNNDVQESMTSDETLRIAGISTIVFSLLLALVVLFAIPPSYRAVSGLFLVTSGMFTIGGIVMWVIGKVKGNRRIT